MQAWSCERSLHASCSDVKLVVISICEWLELDDARVARGVIEVNHPLGCSFRNSTSHGTPHLPIKLGSRSLLRIESK